MSMFIAKEVQRYLVTGLLCSLLWPALPASADDATGTSVQPVLSSPSSSSQEILPGSMDPFPAKPEDYRLRAGDELVITFLGINDPPYDVRIRADGGLFIPRIGEVKAAGQTLVQLRPKLEGLLSRHLVHSTIQVGLKSMAPHFVMILGEVLRPGQAEVGQHTTILQAMAEAGGPSVTADASQATVVRNQKPMKVSLNPPESLTYEVQPGDTIYVAKSAKVTVSGAVQAPGTVPVPGGQATIWEILSQCGGPKPEAAMSRVHVTHYSQATVGADSQTLDLSNGSQSPDSRVTVGNGDVIQIPEQRVNLVSMEEGTKSDAIKITGPISLVDLLAQAGVSDKRTLSKVSIIRARDMSGDLSKLTPDKVEVVDVTAAIKNGTVNKLGTVGDGDLVVVNPPKPGQGGVQNASLWLSIVSVARTLVP